MARLVVVTGSHRGREFELKDDQTIGRLATNPITVDDKTMSREHTRIWRDDDRWWVEDLGSRNGTKLNGEKIERERLGDNDHLEVGETEFSFLGDGEVTSTPAPPAGSMERPVSPPMSAQDIDFGGGKKSVAAVKEKNLSFSPHANKTGQKPGLLGQDLSQESALGKFLMIGGVIAFAVGVFWLIQNYVAGG